MQQQPLRCISSGHSRLTSRMQQQQQPLSCTNSGRRASRFVGAASQFATPIRLTSTKRWMVSR